jgi:hypothetical protein
MSMNNPNYFYHGTSALAAVCIQMDGFRLFSDNLRNWSGGALGNGIYITVALDTAKFFADVSARSGKQAAAKYVVRAQLTPGTRILRLDGRYDRKLIDYLGREFGKELLSPRFDRALPKNKHLSAVELINLANYLWDRGEKHGGIAAWSGQEDQGPLRRYLTRHKYDGMGVTDSDIGVVVFNPSKLVPEGVYQLAIDFSRDGEPDVPEQSAKLLFEPDWRKLANSAAKELADTIKEIPRLRESLAIDEARRYRDMEKWDRAQLAAYQSEVPRRQACLRRFCERLGISTTDSRVAPALIQAE